jgi:hypothetical protein
VFEALLPAKAQARIGGEQLAGAHHQVVEVERAARVEQRLVGLDDRSRHVRWRPALDLPGGDHRVECGGLGERRSLLAPAQGAAPPRGAQQRQPISHEVDRAAVVQENLARERVERPHLDLDGVRHEWREPRGDACGELQRGIAVERHDQDGGR